MKLPQLPHFRPVPGHGDLPAFDLGAIERTIENAFSAARIDVGSAPMKIVSDTLRRTLGAHIGAAPDARADTIDVIDVTAREVASDDDAPAATRPARGRVTTATFSGPTGSRAYRLYVPSGDADRARPLVVMLHGCTQSPDDFAAGTRMDDIAEREGFLVVYPAQSPNANGSKCWNWYRSQDQTRDGGEPALIAGMVREIAARHRIDDKRIFVAGLSAGGAMAVILGHTYPDLFSAVGVHSGLPFAAAHDIPSAFAAMNADPRGPAPSSASCSASGSFVPTIVFHGDRDTTVHTGNGEAVTSQAIDRFAEAVPLKATITTGNTPAGGRYTRTVHRDAAGRPGVEQWVVHGAGHAWSGGSAAGSYTAPSGPDASDAFARFFLAQQPVEASV